MKAITRFTSSFLYTFARTGFSVPGFKTLTRTGLQLSNAYQPSAEAFVGMKTVVRLAVSSALVALALVIAPVAWFAWGPTKAFPGQHLVNAVAGVLVGPLWAAIIAAVVGTLRIMMGVGTIFAYPGGLPGGVVVGVAYKLLRRVTSRRRALLLAALTEPLGTVLVGGTLAWFIFDPLFAGMSLQARFGSILWLYAGWSLSSVAGGVLGAACLLVIDRVGLLDLLKAG